MESVWLLDWVSAIRRRFCLRLWFSTLIKSLLSIWNREMTSVVRAVLQTLLEHPKPGPSVHQFPVSRHHPSILQPQILGRPSLSRVTLQSDKRRNTVFIFIIIILYSNKRNEKVSTKWITHTVAGAPSNCRPPWFDTRIPCTPCCTARRASSAVNIPLTMIGSDVTDLSQSNDSQVTLLSITALS